LREAFLWSEHRTVRKTATVSLHGNTYQVDPSLAGRRVELVFDPFDLTGIEVRWQGSPAGQAIPHIIGRHAHPKARPEQPVPPAPATGIDYLGLIDAGHDARLAGGAISFADMADTTQRPGQLTTGDAIARENP
jgi:putative transposase